MVFGMLAGNLFIFVDTAMVGNLGVEALASVSVAGVIQALIGGLLMGLNPAIMAITSRRFGEGQTTKVADALHGGMIVGISASVVLVAIFWFAAPKIFGLYPLEPKVYEQAVDYFKITLLLLPVLTINRSFRSFFNGIGQTKIYMPAVVWVVLFNIFLNWVFIYGNLGFPKMGVIGAAVATLVAASSGAVYHFYLGHKYGRDYGCFQSMPDKEVMKSLMNLAIPGSLNSMMVSFSNIIFISILTLLGTAAMTISTVILRVTMILSMPAQGLGMAGSIKAGQTLGAGDADDARRWGWDTIRITVVIMTVISLPMIFIPHLVAGIFIPDAETVDNAVFPMVLVGLSLGLYSAVTVLSGTLNGVGDQKFVFKYMTGLKWLVELPLTYAAAIWWGLGIDGVYIVAVGGYAISFIVVFLRWRSDRWTTRKI